MKMNLERYENQYVMDRNNFFNKNLNVATLTPMKYKRIRVEYTNVTTNNMQD